jgi:hypothetical protein
MGIIHSKAGIDADQFAALRDAHIVAGRCLSMPVDEATAPHAAASTMAPGVAIPPSRVSKWNSSNAQIPELIRQRFQLFG